MPILREIFVGILAGATFAVLLAVWLDRASKRIEAKLDAIAALVALIRSSAGKNDARSGETRSFRPPEAQGGRS
jgi:hypothetical protein